MGVSWSSHLAGVEEGDHFVDHPLEHFVLGDVVLGLSQAELFICFVLPEGEFAVALVEHEFGDFVGEEGVAGAVLTATGLLLDEDGEHCVEDVDLRFGGRGGVAQEVAEVSEALCDLADVLQ